MPLPEVITRLRSHDGLRAIHVIPLTSLDPEHPSDYGMLRRDGWGLVAVCGDGTRLGPLSVEEDAALAEGANK